MVNMVKGEQSARIMSTGDSSPGKTAPHLASSIDALYLGMLLEEQHGGAMVSNSLEKGGDYKIFLQHCVRCCCFVPKL
jgi:hypothetical protein